MILIGKKDLKRILRNQEIIINMLSDVLEAMPDPSKRPDIMAVMQPIFDNPIIKNNPAVQSMLEPFMKQMEDMR